MPKSPTRALPSTPQGASSNAPSLPLAVATDLSGRDSEWLDQRQERNPSSPSVAVADLVLVVGSNGSEHQPQSPVTRSASVSFAADEKGDEEKTPRPPPRLNPPSAASSPQTPSSTHPRLSVFHGNSMRFVDDSPVAKNGEADNFLAASAAKDDCSISIVNMLNRETFVQEDGFARIFLFRMYGVEDALTIHCSCVEGLGAAIPHKHFIPKTENVRFEAGSTLAHLDIQIINDDKWEPIRDFNVRIDKVEGRGIIGRLNLTTCYVRARVCSSVPACL